MASLDEDQTLSYLKGLSIEQLLQTEITSVSKKTEQLFDAAAAVSVITQEDIKRAGIHDIAEALRMVPGMNVARIDGSRWAISARGFNDYFANKLLVLIDGRSVYTPLFSGVYWNAQDTFIDDIERIEVIRGPGATVWGANAVNGVINIITKNSKDTQGGLLVAAAGTYEQPYGGIRYGGKIAENGSYRLFAKGFNRSSLEAINGEDTYDSWQNLRTGFRTDFEPDAQSSFSLQGELYTGAADASIELTNYLTPPYDRTGQGTEDYSGGHLMADWQQTLSKDSVFDLQLYYDRTQRDQIISKETRDTLDVDFKHHWSALPSNDIVWGGGFRWTNDDLTRTWTTDISDDNRSDSLWSAFLQDDINLLADKVWLTLGSKFEHNDYTGFEIQPSARLRYKPSSSNTLWTAISRAVRTPSRAEQGLMVNLSTAIHPESNTISLTRILGTEQFQSEELIAYEAGYRWQKSKLLSLDLAAFYNDYENIRSLLPGTPFPEFQPAPPHLVIPLEMGNHTEGESYGLEFQATWQASEQLQLLFGYTWLEVNLQYVTPLAGGNSPSDEGTSPEHQFHIRSYFNLPNNLSLDAELYYVSELDTQEIEGYVRFDLRLGYQPTPTLKLSLNAENLFNSSHQEFSDRSNIVASEIPTQIWAKMTYSF